MGLAFIDRSLKTFGVVLVIFLPFGLYYFGLYPTLAVFSGGVWSLLNLMLLARLVKVSLRPEGADRGKTLAVALFKFPVLYVAGYFLLKIPQFDPILLAVGFTSLFAIIVLKALGRMVVPDDDRSQRSRNVQGMA